MMKQIDVVLLKNPSRKGYMPVCSDTLRSPRDVSYDMSSFLAGKGIEINFSEKEENIDGERAFQILINEKTLEELVPLPDPSKYCGMSCESCGSAKKNFESSCPRFYTEVPESVLRLAIRKESSFI
ncbi:hypothetical protein J2128_001475 [Methanomicrobium sp. W14]|jgi:hypothetical protein|uniref:DUF2703 domain-containing protein n=1 Tax=Methanomicrobium sp. W14 TaxID=2817839 RepID=UPI001AE1A01E|nr:DUF2703 domain-containing protein [Methanomicrobium sp. W14]MBP2133521.1 hypothetical protein [Methanomicrobium sp. W14]